jgi:ferrous iron transport protein B
LIGKKIEPVIEPLGFNWKIGIAILSSFAAREVFVGTMSTIYQSGNDEDLQNIKEKLDKEKNTDGSKSYSAATCWSLLIFYAIALQCMSTVATVKRESKSWKFSLLQFVLFTSLAYLCSLVTYQLLI